MAVFYSLIQCFISLHSSNLIIAHLLVDISLIFVCRLVGTRGKLALHFVYVFMMKEMKKIIAK